MADILTMNDNKSAFSKSLEGMQEIVMYKIPVSFVNNCIEELVSITKKEPVLSITNIPLELSPISLLTTI
jgi:hypothetical protein